MSSEKLTAIEEKIAYQEHLLDVLNARVVAQQRQIDTLVAGMQRLAQQLRGLAQAGRDDAGASEIPPHY